MRILHINCVYPYGSTGRITENIHSALVKSGHKSLVLYGRGKKAKLPDTIKVCTEFGGKAQNVLSRFTGLVYGGCSISTRRVERIIMKFQPDIVHLQCINGFFVNIYELIRFLKTKRIKTVLTLHAEFMYTANCGCSYGCEKWRNGCGDCPDLKKATGSIWLDRTAESQKLMKAAFDGFESDSVVVSVSDYLKERAEISPVLMNCRHTVIKNGIDTSKFAESEDYSLRKELGINDGQKMILWVTSLFNYEKGMDYFWKLTEMMPQDEYRFVVAGSDKPEGYCGDVVFLGKIADQKQLAEVYSAADVMLCCSRQESYPTVSLEAQCCGTPVVGFDVGGVKETIIDGMGKTVPLGNLRDMIAEITRYAELDRAFRREKAAQCRKIHSSERMVKEYMQLYQTLLSNEREN